MERFLKGEKKHEKGIVGEDKPTSLIPALMMSSLMMLCMVTSEMMRNLLNLGNTLTIWQSVQ